MAEIKEVKNHIRKSFSLDNIVRRNKYLKSIYIGGSLATKGKSNNDVDLIADINEDILDEDNYTNLIINIISDIEKSFPDVFNLEKENIKVDIQFFVLTDSNNNISQYGKVHYDNTISKSIHKEDISNKKIGRVNIFD